MDSYLFSINGWLSTLFIVLSFLLGIAGYILDQVSQVMVVLVRAAFMKSFI